MNRLMRKTQGLAIIALISLALQAQAKTPDGKTPAEETVCNALQDATPGLYGLCVAFCEAHDADAQSAAGDPAELRRPDLKLLDNYDRKRRESDPPMPCLIEPQPDDGPTGNEPPVGACPCWTAVELEEMMPPINNTDVPVPGACTDSASNKALYNYENGASGPGFSLKLYGVEGCDVLKTNYDAGAPAGSLFFLTQDQVEACTTLLVNHANKYSTPGVWDCFDGQ